MGEQLRSLDSEEETTNRTELGIEGTTREASEAPGEPRLDPTNQTRRRYFSSMVAWLMASSGPAAKLPETGNIHGRLVVSDSPELMTFEHAREVTTIRFESGEYGEIPDALICGG